jgi:hypothetical protein
MALGEFRSSGRSQPWYSNTPPQGDESPSSATKCLTLAEGRALVSMSAIMSSVGQ